MEIRITETELSSIVNRHVKHDKQQQQEDDENFSDDDDSDFNVIQRNRF